VLDTFFFPPVFFAFLLEAFSVDVPDSLEHFFCAVLDSWGVSYHIIAINFHIS
jgi:hypothetical protein